MKDRQSEKLTRGFQRERERYKHIWGMNFEQLVEHDTTLAAKDEEIAELQGSLRNVRVPPHATPPA